MKELFFRESYAESLNMLRDAINNRDTPFWDDVIVTTGSRSQAECYIQLFKQRLDEGYLPKSCTFDAVPDASGARIGSGGSTLSVMAKLYNACACNADAFLNRRILILHTGGDAKRMPSSAPLGKLFTLTGSTIWGGLEHPSATVFDDIMASLAGMPSRMRGGVVVVAADALFRFNHTQVDMDTLDAIAFTMKCPVSEGAVHGVFQSDAQGRVVRFLHKLPEERLTALGAVSKQGEVDMDIGITYLGRRAVIALMGLVTTDAGHLDDLKLRRFMAPGVCLSFYGDILYTLASSSTLESYMNEPIEGERTPELLVLRRGIYEALHPVGLWLSPFAPGTYKAMGTTVEVLGYAKGMRGQAADITFVRHIDSGAVIGEDTRIEYSRISKNVTIGARCLVSDCDIPESTVLNDGLVLHTVPLRNGKWVCRVFGVDDNPKTLDSWLNRPFDGRYQAAGALSLWSTPLFPLCNTQEEAIRWAILLADGLDGAMYAQWRQTERLALSNTEDIDICALLARRTALDDEIRTAAFVRDLLQGVSVHHALPLLGRGAVAGRRIEDAVNKIETGSYSRWADTMRLYIGLAEASECLSLPIDAESLRKKGFEAIKAATVVHMRKPTALSVRWMQEETTVALPIRVNMGGSWSDAPPYCYEHGGMFINAAFSIDGRLPIRVTVRRIDDLVVECISEDLKAHARYTTLNDIRSYHDPTDAFILFKAALITAGIIDENGATLNEQLSRLGGGVSITTSVSVPKGSGLGTSSILSGALIDALTRMIGCPHDTRRIINDVLLAEQLMTTGGGWQDAIGGMIPGIKTTYTEPGIPQIFDIQPVIISEDTKDALNGRAFLLYTGQRRLAKSVLRRVLSNYILNKADSLDAIGALARLTPIVAYTLRRGDISAVGELLSEHMRLLRKLDASCSNLMIDYIIDGLAPFINGVSICGAGGGGFLFGILKPEIGFDQLDEWIHSEYGEGTLIRAYKVSLIES